MRYLKYIAVLYILISSTTIAQVSALQRLLDAVELGDHESVRSGLRQGMDVNSTDEIGNTLLMIASHFGRQAIVADLVQAGADIRRRNRAGDDALMLAALKGDPEIAQMLIQRGAELDREGWTPLHYAAFGGSVAVIRMLIEKGADRNRIAPNGYTPLMLAVRSRRYEAVRELLLWDPRLDIPGPAGETALSLARGLEDAAIVALLQRAGAVH